jgi:hypothetical protein
MKYRIALTLGRAQAIKKENAPTKLQVGAFEKGATRTVITLQ